MLMCGRGLPCLRVAAQRCSIPPARRILATDAAGATTSPWGWRWRWRRHGGDALPVANDDDNVRFQVHGHRSRADGPAPWAHRVTVIACGRKDPQLLSARCAHPRGVEPVLRIDCGFIQPGGDG
jgi:hypothetical protein